MRLVHVVSEIGNGEAIYINGNLAVFSERGPLLFEDVIPTIMREGLKITSYGKRVIDDDWFADEVEYEFPPLISEIEFID